MNWDLYTQFVWILQWDGMVDHLNQKTRDATMQCFVYKVRPPSYSCLINPMNCVNCSYTPYKPNLVHPHEHCWLMKFGDCTSTTLLKYWGSSNNPIGNFL